MANTQSFDPLEELLSRQRAAINGDRESDVNNTPDISDVDITGNVDINEDEYGDNDLIDEIENEEKAYQEAREELANEKVREVSDKNASKVIMPPDEYDMKYHEDAIGYQSEKISVVSNMVNKVVAKYRLISGGIPDVDTEVNDVIVRGRMSVMGELVDIYHNNGEKITPSFERLILSNWIMPDNTLAIDNINENGYVIDKTMMNASSVASANTESSEKSDTEEETHEVPTININVEQNTPVTVNVDESITSKLNNTNEVNIYVKEVTQQEMMAATIVENSQQEGIINVYDSGINDVPVTLPLSAYRCVLRPINWFDFIKLTAPTSQNGSDNELKKWSVIYEHIKNPSIGQFKDFEDFMKKTKYQDRELLMWGLLVATADDEETLSITCGNPKCKKNIRIPYRPRNIVHLDKEHIPDWYMDVHDASVGKEAIKVFDSVNSRRKRYKLPSTGIIVEINEPSAYEFVTQKLPLINDLFKRYRPDKEMTEVDMSDPSMAEFDYLSANALFVSAMTIIRNENGKEKEYRFTNWDDIEKIITTALDTTDSGILLKLIEKSRSNVSPVSFRVENITCSSCGRHEEYIPITDIGNSLLFQVSRRLSNTQINLIEMD